MDRKTIVVLAEANARLTELERVRTAIQQRRFTVRDVEDTEQENQLRVGGHSVDVPETFAKKWLDSIIDHYQTILRENGVQP